MSYEIIIDLEEKMFEDENVQKCFDKYLTNEVPDENDRLEEEEINLSFPTEDEVYEDFDITNDFCPDDFLKPRVWIEKKWLNLLSPIIGGFNKRDENIIAKALRFLITDSFLTITVTNSIVFAEIKTSAFSMFSAPNREDLYLADTPIYLPLKTLSSIMKQSEVIIIVEKDLNGDFTFYSPTFGGKLPVVTYDFSPEKFEFPQTGNQNKVILTHNFLEIAIDLSYAIGSWSESEDRFIYFASPNSFVFSDYFLVESNKKFSDEELVSFKLSRKDIAGIDSLIRFTGKNRDASKDYLFLSYNDNRIEFLKESESKVKSIRYSIPRGDSSVNSELHKYLKGIKEAPRIKFRPARMFRLLVLAKELDYFENEAKIEFVNENGTKAINFFLFNKENDKETAFRYLCEPSSETAYYGKVGLNVEQFRAVLACNCKFRRVLTNTMESQRFEIEIAIDQYGVGVFWDNYSAFIRRVS